MTHLVAPLLNLELQSALHQLSEAHDFLVEHSIAAMATAPRPGPLWGVHMKRLHVSLPAPGRPAVIGKDSERFVEVVNMVATLERLNAALTCLEGKKQELGSLRVRECHPATSSTRGSNDLVLEHPSGAVAIRCEVCDVASDSAGSNGKEWKDLESLGCAEGVPSDNVRRLLCTSPEFAGAIQRAGRKWSERRYRYREFAVEPITGTVLLEIVSPSELQAS
jgi:hypothetical protein